jgi:hypothetical protein
MVVGAMVAEAFGVVEVVASKVVVALRVMAPGAMANSRVVIKVASSMVVIRVVAIRVVPRVVTRVIGGNSQVEVLVQVGVLLLLPVREPVGCQLALAGVR